MLVNECPSRNFPSLRSKFPNIAKQKPFSLIASELKKKPKEKLSTFIMDCCVNKLGELLLLMCSNGTLVRWASAEENAMEKHVKHFDQAKYLGWKIFDDPTVAQVWIHSAGLEVTELTTIDNPIGTPISNKPVPSEAKVAQSDSAIGDEVSGDCNLHSEQDQVYNHNMNTKNEASGKKNDDISQGIDTKGANILKGKPPEIGKEGYNMGSLKLIFLVEGNTPMMCCLGFHMNVMVVLLTS